MITSAPLSGIDSFFNSQEVPDALQRISPGIYAASANFFSCILGSNSIEASFKELVILALHASASLQNGERVRQQIERAALAGATPAQIFETLVASAGLGNHALYDGLPVLMEELDKLGRPDAVAPPMTEKSQAIKQEFIEKRNFWNDHRELIACVAPEYFEALSFVAIESWSGPGLSAKQRELLGVAIDCTASHTYGPGLRMHMRHALELGATRDEIVEVLQLSALAGMEGLLLGAETLASVSRAAQL